MRLPNPDLTRDAAMALEALSPISMSWTTSFWCKITDPRDDARAEEQVCSMINLPLTLRFRLHDRL